ncbi:MAG: hypothetical protein RIS94_973 [Pseudomonadota bacterium]|jgi:asparagine synthase (glutamine-hydrolysing)
MTAILAAFHRTSDDHAARADADRMALALARYGALPPLFRHEPAPGGGAIALAKRLMPLLPEDRYPDPLASAPSPTRPASRWTVAADVRLTDRTGLAASLGLAETLAATTSDALLVALALDRWGDDAFARIEGPFAAIAFDGETGRILMARDFAGERPLLFHRSDAGLWAASMPEGLLALPHVPTGADQAGYEAYLRAIDFGGSRTPYAGLERVCPGHLAIYDPRTGQVTQSRHWQPNLTPLRLPRQQDYETALATTLDRAVAASLRGVEGEVGAHLSAGFDSTAVVVTAARQLAARGGRVVAFTGVPRPGIVPPLPAHMLADEGPLAAATAAFHPNIDHVRVAAQAGPLEGMERALPRSAMPVPNVCNLPWIDAIAQTAQRRGLTVLLHGSAGNATISESGVAALPELLRAGRLIAWARLGHGLVRNRWMRWRGVLWNSLSPLLPRALWHGIERAAGREPLPVRRYSALRDEAYAAGPRLPDSRPGMATSLEDRLAIFRQDQGCLLKADLAQWGLDLRDPTGDRALVQLALRIPVERLVWGGQPRAILRKVLAGHAPPEVIDSRLRGYQAADWVQALHAERAGLRAEMESLARFEPIARVVDIARLTALVDAMPAPDSPAWGDPAVEADYRYAMLRGVSAARHMRMVAGSNA